MIETKELELSVREIELTISAVAFQLNEGQELLNKAKKDIRNNPFICEETYEQLGELIGIVMSLTNLLEKLWGMMPDSEDKTEVLERIKRNHNTNQLWLETMQNTTIISVNPIHTYN